MIKGLIRLCYRKSIDATAIKTWDKYVFEDTYKEFYMQAQQFDQQQQYATFREMLEKIPKADQMHYLVSTAATGYIRQLNEKMPDVVNVLGDLFVPFRNFRFEIIQSHIQHKDQHKVAISFYSETFTWIDTVHDRLLLAQGNQTEAIASGREVETHMLVLRPDVGIFSCQMNNASPVSS